jgi:hypothetical protein
MRKTQLQVDAGAWIDAAITQGTEPELWTYPDGRRRIFVTTLGVVGPPPPALDEAQRTAVGNELLRRGMVCQQSGANVVPLQRGSALKPHHRKPRAAQSTEVDREISRLREIALESSENMLVGGPVHPDAKLLDFCAEALHLLVSVEKRLEAKRRAIEARTQWSLDTPQEKQETGGDFPGY